MATRAAIASKDRKSKEEIARRDRAQERYLRGKDRELKQRELDIKNEEMKINRASKSAQAAGALARGIGSIAAVNDPEWYKKYGYDSYAVSLPTFYRSGKILTPGWRSNIDSGYDNVPGVWIINWQHTLPNPTKTNTYGNNFYKGSPLNVSLVRFMAELRKLNSRIGEYDPADIGLYLYSLAGLASLIVTLGKVLKIYNTYYAENAYFSRIMIQACGFDFTDIVSNIADVKMTYRRYISIFNANAVMPANLSFLLRTLWLSSVMVRDHHSDSAQIYMFRNDSYGYLSSDETEVVYPTDSKSMTWTTIKNRLELQVQNLFNSVGMVTITSDLRAAFPQNKLIQLKDESLNICEFSESKHDLEQIHNIITLPSIYTNNSRTAAKLSNRNITQDEDGNLIQGTYGGTTKTLQWQFEYASGHPVPAEGTDLSKFLCQGSTAYLNFYEEEDVSQDMILEATRGRCVCFSTPVESSYFLVRSVGTEIFINYTIYQMNDQSEDEFVAFEFGSDIMISATFNDMHRVLELLSHVSTFDWAPIIKAHAINSINATTFSLDSTSPKVYGEVDHPVAISRDNLDWMHTVACFSEFYTDEFAANYVAR